MVTIGESFVERAEKALVETAILAELERNNHLGESELVQRVRNIGGFDEKVDDKFVRSCIRRLDRDGHLEQKSGRFAITPDGREDVRKVEGLLCCVAAAEVPGVTVPPEYRPGGAMGPRGGL